MWPDPLLTRLCQARMRDWLTILSSACNDISICQWRTLIAKKLKGLKEEHPIPIYAAFLCMVNPKQNLLEAQIVCIIKLRPDSISQSSVGESLNTCRTSIFRATRTFRNINNLIMKWTALHTVQMESFSRILLTMASQCAGDYCSTSIRAKNEGRGVLLHIIPLT
jgi:hypothetical protein